MDNQRLKGTKFKRNEKIHVTSIDNEMGFMNVDKGQYYAANEVGTDIWNLLSEPKTLDEIVDELLAVYDIDRKICQNEVEDFLHVMLNEELVLSIDLK